MNYSLVKGFGSCVSYCGLKRERKNKSEHLGLAKIQCLIMKWKEAGHGKQRSREKRFMDTLFHTAQIITCW